MAKEQSSLPKEAPLCSLGCCLGFSSLASATSGYSELSVNYLWVSLLLLEGGIPCGRPQEMTKTCCNTRSIVVSKLQVADTIQRWDLNRNYYLCVHYRDRKNHEKLKLLFFTAPKSCLDFQLYWLPAGKPQVPHRRVTLER